MTAMDMLDCGGGGGVDGILMMGIGSNAWGDIGNQHGFARACYLKFPWNAKKTPMHAVTMSDAKEFVTEREKTNLICLW